MENTTYRCAGRVPKRMGRGIRSHGLAHGAVRSGAADGDPSLSAFNAICAIPGVKMDLQLIVKGRQRT